MKWFYVALIALGWMLGGCSLASTPAPQPTLQPPARPSLAPSAAATSTIASTATLEQSVSAPASPAVTASPTFTSLPASSTPTVTPLPCLGAGGRVETGSLRSKLLKLPMEYSVYLPPCYDEQVERRYPVLYLIHGMNYNNDQWHRLGADETAARLIAAGELNPFIIVMPRDRSWELPEYDPFGEVLVEALIPLIDTSYRTQPDRAHRAIGGLSRGAGWAVHLGLSRWDLFGAIGGHSLPVFWSDTGKVRGWLKDIPAGDYPRIYLDIGDHDRPSILKSARWFEGVLTEAEFPHEWYLFSGFHEEAYWSAHVEAYLRWYAQEW